jgi:SAM-dependent methyltransferase
MDQEGLYEHWQDIAHGGAEDDFRAAALEALLADRLDPARPVLDVGCGAAGLVVALQRRGFDCRGFDDAEEMLALGRERLTAAGLDPGLIEQRPLADAAQALAGSVVQAVCSDVIEHIEDDRAAVAHLRTLLSPGGRLVLTVPAMPSLYGPKDVRLGHHRRYTRDALRALFTDDAWEVTGLRSWNLLGVPVTWFAVKVRRRAVDESVRTGGGSSALGRALRWWFRSVENRVRPPTGLTLVLEATRR